MKTRTVKQSSIFPASPQQVFSRLRELKTLQAIASPYASFLPAGGHDRLVWEEGATFQVRLRLFFLIPCGIHTVHVIQCSASTYEICTKEPNPYIPMWNHRITLKDLGNGQTAYTDEVEISAGWKTAFVCAWAERFFAHRQRRWIKLLNS